MESDRERLPVRLARARPAVQDALAALLRANRAAPVVPVLEVSLLDDASAGEAHERRLESVEPVDKVLAQTGADEVRARGHERDVVELEGAPSADEKAERALLHLDAVSVTGEREVRTLELELLDLPRPRSEIVVDALLGNLADVVLQPVGLALDEAHSVEAAVPNAGEPGAEGLDAEVLGGVRMDRRAVLEGKARHSAAAEVGFPSVLNYVPLLVVRLKPVEASVREELGTEASVGGPVDVLEEDAVHRLREFRTLRARVDGYPRLFRGKCAACQRRSGERCKQPGVSHSYDPFVARCWYAIPIMRIIAYPQSARHTPFGGRAVSRR